MLALPHRAQTHSRQWSSLISPRAAEAPAEKEDLAQSPAIYSFFSLTLCFSRDCRSTALRPIVVTNYEGYFQHCNLKHIWYTRTRAHLQNRTLSKYTLHGSKDARGGGQERRLRCPQNGTCPIRSSSLQGSLSRSSQGGGLKDVRLGSAQPRIAKKKEEKKKIS